MKKILLTLTAIAALMAPPVKAAISVGPSPTGTGILTFDTLPAVADWSTRSPGGASADFAAATLDAGIQTNVASAINVVLGESATVDPSISANALARRNTVNLNLQTPPTSVAYTMLLATLQNDTGASATGFTVTYDFGELSAAGTTVVEEVPGHRVFWSLSGDANSWQLIPELSAGTLGAVSASVSVGTWSAGSLLYLLFVDDNAAADRNNANTEEGGYTIDNFSLTADQGVVPPSIVILTPTNNTVVPQSATLNVTTLVRGAVNSVDFFVDGSLAASDAISPFTLALDTTFYSLGNHILSARANVEGGTTIDTTNQTFTLTANQAPVIAITNVYSGTVTGFTFLVGSPVVFQTQVSDDIAVTNMEWYLDGQPYILNRVAANPNYPNITYVDSLAGTHQVYGVAVDNSGQRTDSSVITLTITNPPPNVTQLITNGSEWLYYGTNLSITPVGATVFPPPPNFGGTWTEAFYDLSFWTPLFTEIGGGDAVDGYPEKSIVEIGPTGARFLAHYFRKSFFVPTDAAFENLQLRLLRDDGAIVFLNGTPIWTNNMATTDLDANYPTPPPWVFAYNNVGTNSDDGLNYQVLNIVGAANIFDNNLIIRGQENVVCVEVHQQNPTSSDVSFDLMLWGMEPSLPTIVITSPTDNQEFIENASATVTVNASLFVTNVAIKLDGVVVAQSGTPPFTVTIPSVGAVGTHQIVAEATDVLGSAPVLSETVTINVGYNGELFGMTNTVWQYLDNGTDQGTAWTATGFDDSAWGSGPSPLGYGDANGEFPRTTNSYGPDSANKYITTYYRHSFNISTPAAVHSLLAQYRRDDGVVVYLNGTEVFRCDNMPAGPVTYTTTALAAVAGDGVPVLTNSIPANLLVAGKNVIAAEIHQDAVGSSDLFFALSLFSNLATDPPTVAITSPTNTQTIAAACAGGATVTVNAAASIAVTNVAFSIDGGAPINDGAAPFTATFTGVVTGPHTLTAVAEDSAGRTTNAVPVNITVTAAVAPSLAITSISSGGITGLVFPVGVCLTNQLGITGVITNLHFVVNGKTNQTLTASQDRTRVELNDVLAGNTVLELVGLDGCGAVVRSVPVTVTITNPPAPVSVIINNGSTWKYSATSNAPPNDVNGLAWTALDFIDTAWPSGQAELGGGDGLDVPPNTVPETTVIDIGPSGDRYHAIYFRHEFTVASPSSFTNLIVNLLRDDGGVVFLNGAEIFRSNMADPPAVIDYSSFALGTADDDGTLYYRGTTNNTLVAGRNILAVEVHQSSITSSDISFDLMLWGQSATATRPALQIVNNGTQFVISWTGTGTLQSKNSLSDPQWTDVPSGNTSPVVIPISSSGAAKFYTLRQ